MVLEDTLSAAEQIAPAKKSNHRTNVVRITDILPHANSHSLELVRIDGYQAVVRKGSFQPGSLAVYIQPDSVVPQTEPFRFVWADHVGLDGKVPEKRRRITVRKFRGEWSEGLLLPVTDFPDLSWYNRDTDTASVAVRPGDDVSGLLGITHYDPEQAAGTFGVPALAPRRKRPKTFRGWVHSIIRRIKIAFGRGSFHEIPTGVDLHLPVYDVEAFKNFKSTFEEGEQVVVTEKIHGSNARFVFLDGEMYAGSRNQWRVPGSPGVWARALQQNPWIEQWCRAHPGYALYGEVTPTQKGFNYGSTGDEARFFLFDVHTPEGAWVPYSDLVSLGVPSDLIKGEGRVPLIYCGPFDAAKVVLMASGPSLVPGANHIREGIVIRPLHTERRAPGLGRVNLKLVSNEFLMKDSEL